MRRTVFISTAIAVMMLLAIGCSTDSGPTQSDNVTTGPPSMSPVTYAYIGDLVWYDLNCDGIQDLGEPGVEGVTVHLFDCDDNHIASMLTDAVGYYWFQTEWDADYYVKFDLPAGYTFSPQDQGIDDAIDSDADPTSGKADCTYLDAWEEDPTWDAGLCMEEPPDSGCSHTIGYWKNYDGEGPQDDEVTQYLPITLGSGGGKSLDVTTAAISTDVLEQKTYGKPSNGITKLYAQLLGAKLSVASGASDSDVAEIISDADAFLAMYDYTDWKHLSDEDTDSVKYWHGMLDDYNNGIIGPGHCDEFDDDDGIGKRNIK